jgi:hypothetical protein
MANVLSLTLMKLTFTIWWQYHCSGIVRIVVIWLLEMTHHCLAIQYGHCARILTRIYVIVGVGRMSRKVSWHMEPTWGQAIEIHLFQVPV